MSGAGITIDVDTINASINDEGSLTSEATLMHTQIPHHRSRPTLLFVSRYSMPLVMMKAQSSGKACMASPYIISPERMRMPKLASSRPWTTSSMHNTCGARCGRKAPRACTLLGKRGEGRERKRKIEDRSTRARSHRTSRKQGRETTSCLIPRSKQVCDAVRTARTRRGGKQSGKITLRDGRSCSKSTSHEEDHLLTMVNRYSFATKSHGPSYLETAKTSTLMPLKHSSGKFVISSRSMSTITWPL